MKLYCYVKNNEVILTNQLLPQVWENVSNFHTLPDDILKKYGWVPLIVESVNKPIFVSSTYDIQEDFVKQVVVTRDKTQEEINNENNEHIKQQWQEVRNHRNELLRESDTYVLIDRWNIMSTEKQQEWSQYRQNLRNIPQEYTNPEEVVFPVIPT